VELNGGRTETDVGILGDIFESFIGALYLDSNCNLELCKIFVTHLIETKIDIAKLLHNETNYKDMLLKYFHKMKWTDPLYETKITQDNKKRSFVMCVKDNNGKIIGTGEGNSKKKGEQIAAHKALELFGELNEDSEQSEIEIEA
jgi:dsRNA-specific ribonuclease